MSRLAKFKANLKHYPDPKIGDTIKIGTGRAIWTITHVFESTRLGCKGHTYLRLVNSQGTSHRGCYLEDAKFAVGVRYA
jgi:hypothetical protein